MRDPNFNLANARSTYFVLRHHRKSTRHVVNAKLHKTALIYNCQESKIAMAFYTFKSDAKKLLIFSIGEIFFKKLVSKIQKDSTKREIREVFRIPHFQYNTKVEEYLKICCEKVDKIIFALLPKNSRVRFSFSIVLVLTEQQSLTNSLEIWSLYQVN